MKPNEIEKLLVAMANGWASREDIEQLESAIGSDPALRDKVAEWLCDESLLHKEAVLLDMIHSDPGGGPVVALPAEQSGLLEPYRRDRTRRLPWISMLCGGALACSLLLNAILWNGSALPPSKIASGKPEGSRFVKATGCVWGSAENALSPRLGRRLVGGDMLQLIQGIAEFEINRGGVSGRVRLQGPASAVMRSDGIPTLLSGRLVADLSVYGAPLALDTPLGAVEVSEYASFGIEASGEAVKVHALEGRVRVRPRSGALDRLVDLDRDAGSGPQRPCVLQQGEAAHLAHDHRHSVVFNRMAADASVFAEEKSMATNQLTLDPDYPRMILDSRPAGYWRFEQSPVDGELPSEVHGDLALEVAGSVTRVRQGGNYVLEFGMTRDSGHLLSRELWPTEPLDACSIELWFKPSHFHNGALLTLVNPEHSNSQRDVNALIVELGGPHNLAARRTQYNSIRFVNRSPALPGVELGAECSADRYAIREWQHLAAVKDGAQLRLHLNGVVVATAVDDRPIPSRMQMVLGQIFTKRPARRFIGQMDELVVYTHALAEQDVARHYAAGARQALGAGEI